MINESPLAFKLDDSRILSLLVERRLRGYNFGLRAGGRSGIAEKLGIPLMKVAPTLRRLEREGLVEGIRMSHLRWHATSRAIALHGFAEGLQRGIEDFL